ncbi:hypothetical protein [Mucilaginibacter sp. UYCu711]|uniref:hypothetical protein n=1 Tax=Mucilaginibacter sp. UYCu711 TaxID=3156339 RepID=UPI003D1E37E5
MPTPAAFKQSLYMLLQSHIDEVRPLNMDWICSFCRDGHTGNLLKKVTAIKTDVPSGDLKADIGLFTTNMQLFAAIHISKNKKVKEDTLAYYLSKDIIYIQIQPNEDYVITTIEQPFCVGTCLNPKCTKCGSFQHEKSLFIIDSECWKCDGSMKIAILSAPSYCSGPDTFTDDQLTFARSKGVIIRNNYSKTVGHSYLSNTCPHCEVLTGDHYLWEHLSEAMYGNLTYERFPMGYFCETCRWRNED